MAAVLPKFADEERAKLTLEKRFFPSEIR